MVSRHSIFVAVALLLLGVTSVRADIVWERTFGGPGSDEGRAVAAVSTGGFVIGGRVTESGQPPQARVIRVDDDGNTLWQTDIGGAAQDFCLDILEYSDGGFVVAGYTGVPPSTFNALVARLDADGDVLWERSFGGVDEDIARAVAETADGDILIAGETRSFPDNGIYLARITPYGNLRWQRGLGQPADYAHGVAERADGGIVLAGYRSDGSLAPEHDMLVVNTTAFGLSPWVQTFDTGVEDRAYGLTKTPDGGFAANGQILGRMALWKLDASGVIQWHRRYAGSDADYATSVAATTSGFLLSGHYYNHGGSEFQAVVVRSNLDGELLDAVETGGAQWEFAWGITACANGDYVMAGATTSFGEGGYDWYVVRGTVGAGVVAGVGDTPRAGLSLSAAPNPFNPQTRISYDLPSAGPAELAIFDVRGRRVATLFDGNAGAGPGTVTWSGIDDRGRDVPSGVYFARLSARGVTDVHKLVVAK